MKHSEYCAICFGRVGKGCSEGFYSNFGGGLWWQSIYYYFIKCFYVI